MRALIIDADAANRLTLGKGISEDWLETLGAIEGIQCVSSSNFTYLIGNSKIDVGRLLVIACRSGLLLGELPRPARLEAFLRLLRSGLSQFHPGYVKLPLDWRLFHSGSLLSFQTNRIQTGISSRACFDMAPEGTDHVYMFHIDDELTGDLTRKHYDADLFVEAILEYDNISEDAKKKSKDRAGKVGHLTVDLTEIFGETNIVDGIPFSTWRDVKLTRQQRDFFDAPFNGPLRVKGPAGSGKTLVLTMRFLKEIYQGLDAGKTVRACFLAHGQETAEHIVKYLMQIDERSLLFDLSFRKNLDIEVTTLHGLADRFINRDTENIQPLSLDGNEGRRFQLELVQSIVSDYVHDPDWETRPKGSIRPVFLEGLQAPLESSLRRGFCYDLSDEFANVLEALGVRAIDEISPRYLKARPSERALAQTAQEKHVVLSLYRKFRQELTELGVVSLDQFTADFLAYLNSFRWDALRKENGFDFIFADELHLFNAQERRVLGYLLRESESPKRVAVAYDPRQSPRNSFFPEARTERDTIWSEAGLDTSAKPFELTDVFRYTPQIMAFLDRLNQQFPASDLAEEWALKFGTSQVADGPTPKAEEFETQSKMAEIVASRARLLLGKIGKGEHVAVLCLDYERFGKYRDAGIFQDNFVSIGSRDELGSVERFRKRAVLSMPEYVAGLQFRAVLLVDANANLVAELGGGVNGLHKFISSVYLGASRAKHQLEIYSDLTEGGLALPIKDSIDVGLVEKKSQ